nr:MAG TPA: hypothetical protein [Caudoviricetes sp.]
MLRNYQFVYGHLGLGTQNKCLSNAIINSWPDCKINTVWPTKCSEY